MKKFKVVIIVLSVLLIIGAAIGITIVVINKNKIKNENKEEIKSYVEENDIEVTSATDLYEVPIKPYAKDENKNIIDVDGVDFEETKGTFKYYDYDVSEADENGYAIHSFKYDIEIPVKYTVDTSKENPKWYRSLAIPNSIHFDKYTGDVYREKNVSVDGSKISYYNPNNIGADDEFSYTNITWKDQTYKIGVRVEVSAKWDGVKEAEDNNGIKTYTDTCRATAGVFIYAPKDYDGLMVAINKNGTSRAAIEAEMNAYKKYLEEHKDNPESEEERQVKTYKILSSQFGDDSKHNKDEFYIMNVKDIKPVEK